MSYPSVAALSLLQQVAPAPYVDRFARVLGSRLGPEYVTSVQAQADLGYFYSWADLLTECRLRDAHLHGVLQRRELRVAGAAWEMRAKEGSGQLGAEVANFCAERLREMEPDGAYGRSFSGMVADLMGAVYHGRAGHELVWREEARDGGGSWWLPRTAEEIAPRRFAMATDWRLHVWDAAGTGESATSGINVGTPFANFPGVCVGEVNALAPGKIVTFTPRVTGGNPNREGVGQVTVWPAVFKRMGVREYVAFIAWAARGLRKGTYRVESTEEKPGASVDHETKLIEALVNWSAQTAAIIPDTCTAEVETVSGEGMPQNKFIEWCNSEESKAVLGSTLGTDAGQRGARSLGEVHERGEGTLAKADAQMLAESLRHMLLRPLVLHNFGPRAPVPEIVFDVEGPDARAETAKMMVELARGGVDIAQRDVRNLVAVPDPKPGDKLLVPVAGPRGGMGPRDPAAATAEPEAPADEATHPEPAQAPPEAA